MFALHRTRRRVGEPANVGRRRACRINPLPRIAVEPLPDAAMRWAPRTLAPNAARLRYDYDMDTDENTARPLAPENEPASIELADADDGALAPPEDEPKKPLVIVMHASVGSGHRSAAYAVAQAFELMRDAEGERTDGQPPIPDDLDIEVIDVLDYGRIVFDGNNAASLFTGATRPIYDLTWRFTLTGRLLWGGGSIWSHLMYSKFTDYVREKQPLAIVCTHITAANVAVAARMLTGQHYPIVCVPTDYETEGLWPHKAADLFCVANESMAETLRPRKVPEESILITGIPTRDDFRRAYDRPSVREQLEAAPGSAHRAGLGGRLPAPPLRALPHRAGQAAALPARLRRHAALRVRGRKRRRLRAPPAPGMRRSGARQRHRARLRGRHGCAHGGQRPGHLQVGRPHGYRVPVRAGSR